MSDPEVQYVTDERGEPTAVIVPIGLWRTIRSEMETRHLLASPAMRTRLLEAMARDEVGIPLDEVIRRLGLGADIDG